VSQQIKGGCWNLLGTYSFGVGNYSVVLANNANGYVIADGIKFELESSASAPTYPFPISDNVDADYTGGWRVANQSAGQYGANVYYHAKGTGQGTARWTLAVPEAGTYHVYACWTSYFNRAPNAPYTVNYEGGSETVYVSQQISGGCWNLLGTYYFGVGNYSVMLSNDANGYVIADAIKFVLENQGAEGDGLNSPPEYGSGTNPDNLDTDGDGMPDAWEVTYGLNPLVHDASDDFDGDGVNNIDEYLAGTDPTVEELSYPPYQPVHTLPTDGSTYVSLTPTLQAEDFDDPDSADTHLKSRWQVSTAPDFSSLVLDVTSTSYLTSLTVDELVLEASTEYYWRVRFYDNHEKASAWSQPFSLTTDIAPDDQTGEVGGIPDEYEVDADEDLDDDGVPDNQQTDIKSLKSVNQGKKIGLKHALMNAAKPLDPNVDIYDTSGKPEEMPYGLITFVLDVAEVGGEASVEVYLSDAAPTGMIWWKFDKIKGGWYDYVDYYGDESLVTFSDDRKKVTLRLKDGAYGDADGVANGRIIDPSGLGTAPVDITDDSGDVDADDSVGAYAGVSGGDVGNSGGGGGGGGGCFIGTLANTLGW
jgi:hypothetical protein